MTPRARKVIALIVALLLRCIAAQQRTVVIQYDGATITRDKLMPWHEPPAWKEPPQYNKRKYGRTKEYERRPTPFMTPMWRQGNRGRGSSASKNTSGEGWGKWGSSSRSSKKGKGKSKGKGKGKGKGDYPQKKPRDECWEYYYTEDDSADYGKWGKGKGASQSIKGKGKGKGDYYSTSSSSSGDQHSKARDYYDYPGKGKGGKGERDKKSKKSDKKSGKGSTGKGEQKSKKMKEKKKCKPSPMPVPEQPTFNPIFTVSPMPTRPTITPMPSISRTPPSLPSTFVASDAPSDVPSSGPSISSIPTTPGPSISSEPTSPTISPMPSTSQNPTGAPTALVTRSSAPSDSLVTRSSAPSDSPTLTLAPSLSIAPTDSPSDSPTDSPRCVTRANLFLCDARFGSVNVDLPDDCECYNFCGDTFVGCCDFGQSCKIDCDGTLVAGCDVVPGAPTASPAPTRMPSPPVPRPPSPPSTQRPTAERFPTPAPSAAPTALCTVGTNVGLCPDVTIDQEPVEGCDCYNYCNGRFNGCCGFFEAEECEQDCVGSVVAGCQLEDAPTQSPGPTATPEPTMSVMPTNNPTVSPQPSTSKMPTQSPTLSSMPSISIGPSSVPSTSPTAQPTVTPLPTAQPTTPSPTVTPLPTTNSTEEPTTSGETSSPISTPPSEETRSPISNDTFASPLVETRSEVLRISLPLYTVHLTIAGSQLSPTSGDLVELSQITSTYLNNHFVVAFSTGMSPIEEFETALLLYEDRTRSSVSAIFRSTALFDSKLHGLPTGMDLLHEIEEAFSSDASAGYLGMLQALPKANIFASTTMVQVSLGTEAQVEATPTKSDGDSRMLIAAIASSLLVIAAAGLSYRLFHKRKENSIEDEKIEDEIAFSTASSTECLSMSILSTADRRPYDYRSVENEESLNWWQVDSTELPDNDAKQEDRSASGPLEKGISNIHSGENVHFHKDSQIWESKSDEGNVVSVFGATKLKKGINLVDCQSNLSADPSNTPLNPFTVTVDASSTVGCRDDNSGSVERDYPSSTHSVEPHRAIRLAVPDVPMHEKLEFIDLVDWPIEEELVQFTTAVNSADEEIWVSSHSSSSQGSFTIDAPSGSDEPHRIESEVRVDDFVSKIPTSTSQQHLGDCNTSVDREDGSTASGRWYMPTLKQNAKSEPEDHARSTHVDGLANELYFSSSRTIRTAVTRPRDSTTRRRGSDIRADPPRYENRRDISNQRGFGRKTHEP